MSRCRYWSGYIDKQGYGDVELGRALGKALGLRPGQYRAHRLVYILRNGPISDKLVLDHTCHSNDPSCNAGNKCRHRRCVNVEHLEPVSMAENIRRGRYPDIGKHNRTKTHCPRGHEYTVENTELRRDGRSRVCKQCKHDLGGFKQRRFKDRCPNGHPWEPDTTYINLKGRKVCRICKRLRAAMPKVN